MSSVDSFPWPLHPFVCPEFLDQELIFLFFFFFAVLLGKHSSKKPTLFKSVRDENWHNCSLVYDVIFSRWGPWRPPAARRCTCSSVRRLPASLPSACDVIDWLYVLQFLIHSSFVFVFWLRGYSQCFCCVIGDSRHWWYSCITAWCVSLRSVLLDVCITLIQNLRLRSQSHQYEYLFQYGLFVRVSRSCLRQNYMYCV